MNTITSKDRLPLVRLGQGEFQKDIYPEDIMNTNEPNSTRINLDFLIREPADTYQARAKECLTAEALQEFRRCPQLYRRKELGLTPDHETFTTVIDRAARTLILEGRSKYESDYAIGGPVNPRTDQPFGPATLAFAEWAEKQCKPALGHAQAKTIEQMACAVREHAVARQLLTDGLANGVVRCTYAEQPCQAWIDWINPCTDAGIIGFETADEIDSFTFTLRAMGHIHRLAFARALVAMVSGYTLPIHVIAVENREPFRCGVWRIESAVLDQAQAENDEAIRELRGCQATDNWFTRFEGLRVIDRL